MSKFQFLEAFGPLAMYVIGVLVGFYGGRDYERKNPSGPAQEETQ
jgi:hypothetical protein